MRVFSVSQMMKIKILLLALLWTTASLEAIPQDATSSGPAQQNRSSPECPPISANMSTVKTGRKAWDKCIDYQELNFPCTSVTGDPARVNLCQSKNYGLIMRDYAMPNEFPHSAILGYGDEDSELVWQCMGTLVSEWFVLTAAHCTSSREFGTVSHVNLNGGAMTSQLDPKRTYRVAQVIRHAMFTPPKFYNDIALLKMNKQIILDARTVPACIYTGDESLNNKVTALSMDLDRMEKGTDSDAPLKMIDVFKSSKEDCTRAHPPTRRMHQGYDEATQLCYSDRSKSNCRDNIFGMIQTYSNRIRCMFWLIGILNVGPRCGNDVPQLYTRVEKYAPWIESVVWP